MEGSAGGLQSRLDGVLADLLRRTPQMEAAAVVSFDGLPMASILPDGMAEDRVAAMSAALLSLGERAADGLGRGSLAQVFVEGDEGTVYLISADDEAVLVAVSTADAKPGLMLFEAKRAARQVAAVLIVDEPAVHEPLRPAAHAAPVAELHDESEAVAQTVTVVPATPAGPTTAAEPAPVAATVDDRPVGLGAPRIVPPRSPADLVPPAIPPTVLAGARSGEDDADDLPAPNVVWAPNGAKSSWS
jgi:uncharacterized protein